MLDIFRNSAFSVSALTDVVNELKYRPSRIRDLGLFSSTAVSTTSIAIESIGDILQLVKPSPRGAPGETRDMPKRKLQNITIPHFQRDWHVYADEVQGIRALGSETQLRTVQQVVGEKMNANMADFEVTEEHARLGAVKGIVTYADGTTLNLFDQFGVQQQGVIYFDLSAADPADGALREKCVQTIRLARKQLGGLSFGNLHAFVGDNFFDKLLKHPEVRETYKGWSDAQILRESYIGPNRASNPIFEFGGIVWENYGEIDGEGIGVGVEEAHIFPTGVPGLFRTYYGPADYIETVNTLGRRLYSKQWPMPNDKGINGEMQSNALQICTRPKVLLKGSSAASG
ncbi:major capsid protein [Pararhizobium haloflavum]|uniref:major capsid protein n=1 Tax=Pararhizobium haloflavum TaxID=2037914 RepID=UPI000C18307F|nr:major capsid protein [Pararhizobium haloflavum]